jgi:predicted lipid-binding transport protein (Tim44 family)
MRRGAIVAGVLGMFLAVLMLTAMAEARAGSGSSGGSRGSRSYSAPRSPSAPASPATPSSPTSPSRSPASPTPGRPGGLLGGWGGMIGGFLLGGLLGSLLFGGMGHLGGFGLLDLLLVGGLIWLAVAFFRRRQPEPALAGVPRGWSDSTATATATEPVSGGGAVLSDQDLAQGVAAIRVMDAGFDPAAFGETARVLFARVQAAWSARDLAPVRSEMTDEMAGTLERDLGRLRTLRRANKVERVEIEAADVTEAWQEYGQDYVTVHFRVSALDYTTDEATGAVLEGSATLPAPFEEYWTFTRPVGSQPWRLSAIQQPAA